MKLVIGGCAQGKLSYVLRKLEQESCVILDGAAAYMGSMTENAGDVAENADVEKKQKHRVIFNHLHAWVKQCLLDGDCPEKKVMELLEDHPDCIIISDEIGNGIVPIDAYEREYRERTGRILVELAGQAEEVERVICGMGQKIK